MIYLQSECTEKYQLELFDVIVESVVPCRKLRWICCKHSNYVARQVAIPGKSTMGLHYTITLKHLDTAKNAV